VSDKAIYLDFAATTPIDQRVVDAMQPCLSPDGAFANPASIHIAGRESSALVEKARQALADLLGADPRCLIWTSGATESDNLAIVGAAGFRAHRGKHLITMPTEHKAVTDTFKYLEKNGYDVTWLEPEADSNPEFVRTRSWCRSCTSTMKPGSYRTFGKSVKFAVRAMSCFTRTRRNQSANCHCP
jgi:cysteine sulfinate desulfinase/cysteine desulfurase-like protein